MSALKFRLPPNDGPVLSVVDIHTGGEPLRIVLSGAPVPDGSTVLEKRRWVRDNMDWVRRLLMLEPRGHRDMYGALLVPSEVPEAHLGVLFMHNEGYSTMCGHAVIALGRFAVDYGLVDPQGPDTPVNIHCPCGVVRAFVSNKEGHSGRVRFHSVPAFALCTDYGVAHLGVLFMHNEGYSTMCGHAVIALGRFAVDYGLVDPQGPDTPVNIHCPCGVVRAFVSNNEGHSGRVRFHSVPAFALYTDVTVDVPGFGKVVVDIAYGGAFYAFVSAERFGLDVCTSKTRDLVDAAAAVTDAVKAQVKISHPDSEDLSFLYGTILTDGKDAYSEEPTANLCIFADSQVDRSPTGSGVTARIALQYHKGLIQLEQTRTFKSGATKSLFTGKAVKETVCGEHKAVIVEVSGQAYYTGTASFVLENEDPLKEGFLLQ